MKKYKKLILILVAMFITFNIIDLSLDQIHSYSDISKQNKITIYDKDNFIIYEKNNLHESSYVTIDNINDITKNVFINIEDKRFFDHNGIDLITTTKAFINNIKNDTLVGGSTITQQYVKNLYLSNEKTYIRKIKELYYAIRIEQLYTKTEILEGYLNTIYFNNGIYGIYDASEFYFNKTPNDLSLKEAISLVSIIKNPTKYCLLNNYDNNTNRSNLLLENLLNREIITSEEYHNAINTKLDIYGVKTQKYSNSILYFKDYVLSNININSSKVEVYTNFDTNLNYYIDNIIENSTCDVSIVVIDKNGYIVSLIGNNNYYKSSYNIATSSSRMIGSTIKPMIYYEALKFGLTTTDAFISEKKDFIVNNNIISIKNASDKYDNSKISMIYASATSDNIYALKTHLFIGTDKIRTFLKRFDIEPINEEYLISLGMQDMSLLELTSIYNTFLNLGYYTNVKSYTSYTQNNLETNNLPLKKELLDERYCYIINDLLSSTFDTNLNATNSVTGASISNLMNKEAFAKSGLTDYDSYMVGFTNDYTIGIWSGHSNNSLLTYYKDKKLPKDLFYKIVNKLPSSQNSLYDKIPVGVNKKEEIILPHSSYYKTIYFI